MLICQLVCSDHMAGILNTKTPWPVSEIHPLVHYPPNWAEDVLVTIDQCQHTPSMVVESVLGAAVWFHLHPHWCAEDGVALPVHAGLLVALG